MDDNDLDLGEFTVQDVFTDSRIDPLRSIVKVYPASHTRESSVPPQSLLRPQSNLSRKRIRNSDKVPNESNLSTNSAFSGGFIQDNRDGRFTKRQRLGDIIPETSDVPNIDKDRESPDNSTFDCGEASNFANRSRSSC